MPDRRRAETTKGLLLISCLALMGPLPSLAAAAPAEHPTVASINLCADQLVLSLADAAQILTVSWLAADPRESMMAAAAARVPPNYGSAEEVLRRHPDVVIGSTYTNDRARALLRRLGYKVVALEPARSLDDIERNLRLVAAAVGHPERGRRTIESMRAERRRIERNRPPRPVGAVVLRPGGFTVSARSLANQLMQLAGLRNIAAERGLDRWGSLSMESLLRANPKMLIVADYRPEQPSLANAVLRHPAVRAVAAHAIRLQLSSVYWSCGLPQSLDSAAFMQAAAAGARRR